MPELAEVEYYRKRWDPGLGQRVVRVVLHSRKRIFRGVNTERLKEGLRDGELVESRAAGKQMLFRFSPGASLGVHLGMTGTMRVEPAGFKGLKHDHLLLCQDRLTLVFSDPRQFGRVLFAEAGEPPDWWAAQGPAILSRGFSVEAVVQFLQRRSKLPIKAALLLQERFPGVGNWMADEVLWRAGIHPGTASGRLSAARVKVLHRALRMVCRGAMRTIGRDFNGPPRGWLFHQRWHRGGSCPVDGTALRYDTIGGRTTAWCRRCQG